MFRLLGDLEIIRAAEEIERAIRERRVVRFSYLKQLRDAKGKPRYFAEKTAWLIRAFGRRPMLAARPSRYTVEPVLLEWKHGMPHVDVIVYTPNGYRARSFRLDRVIAGTDGMRLMVTRQPFRVQGTGLDPTVTHVPKRPKAPADRPCEWLNLADTCTAGPGGLRAESVHRVAGIRLCPFHSPYDVTPENAVRYPLETAANVLSRHNLSGLS